MQILRYLLLPISLVYGLVVYLRNVLYNRGIKRSKSASLPTVVVGNIHMGGTGKTPHTIWLAQQLIEEGPAILSRGYGRKTKGFLKVDATMSSEEAGDEPLSYAKRFPELEVAVCEDRLEGIDRLANAGHKGTVILDDAFQHRKLKGDFNLCLIKANSNVKKEWYFPAGDLRDARLRLRNANAIVFTSSSPAQEADCKKSLEGLIPSTTPIYFSEVSLNRIEGLSKDEKVILVSAIAHNDAFYELANERFDVVSHFRYRDHHEFSPNDIRKWQSSLELHSGSVLLTTEKDFNRMSHHELNLPIHVARIDIMVKNGDDLIRKIRAQIQKKG